MAIDPQAIEAVRQRVADRIGADGEIATRPRGPLEPLEFAINWDADAPSRFQIADERFEDYGTPEGVLTDQMLHRVVVLRESIRILAGGEFEYLAPAG